MIIGIGTDMTEIGRMEAILSRAIGKRFLEKILSESEREGFYAKHGWGEGDPAWNKRAAEHAAGRFAVKEAVSKAFGSGIGGCIGFHDIRVLSEPSGRPVCRVSEEALLRLGLEPAAIRVHISITHTETTAGAFAVVERENGISASRG
ncbi:holo-ACP synthase [Gorillibacterium timonense]|uniref:holo-ACP synthase n=1 Tax=Gorillibacterium timonense TaxID=1689269 RepID=UPI00071DEC91|nr:holo-ACP synthase [Gorillibacterium timonense]